MSCKHETFSSHVKIARFEDRPEMMAEIKIICSECNEPMQFLGLPLGLNLRGAAVDVDGLEARLAIIPRSAEMTPIEVIGVQVMGFKA